MHIIDVPLFIKALEDITCGKARIVSFDSKIFEIKESETKPPDGYEEHPANFPYCCVSHKQLLTIGTDRFLKFPNCCANHSNLVNTTWFKKINYNYFPIKFVTTVQYTRSCIHLNVENPDWESEITDYIEYTIKSYGQFPDGHGAPLGLDLYIVNIKSWLENKTVDIPPTMKKTILKFLDNYYNHESKEDNTDLNLLMDKYAEWLKIFPFEISFFKNLKPYFENQMPILKGEGRTNRYTGLTAFQITTKKELIEFIIATTQKILKEINTLRLHEDNLINDVPSVQLEVLKAKRLLELEKLDKAAYKDKKGYIKVLKTWLSGEKSFLLELAPLLPKIDPTSNLIAHICEGIKHLQEEDVRLDFIKAFVEEDIKDEGKFRDWFKTFFIGRYEGSNVIAEALKGNGRIDLKISSGKNNSKIIEFKGWWNNDKKTLPEQLCSYLTEFEKVGFIFMINNLKKDDITSRYKDIIESAAMNYLPETWKSHLIPNTDLSYFESKHQFAITEKTIFHFIYNVHASNRMQRKNKVK